MNPYKRFRVVLFYCKGQPQMKLLTICSTVIKLTIFPIVCASVSVLAFVLFKKGLPDLIALAYCGNTTNIYTFQIDSLLIVLFVALASFCLGILAVAVSHLVYEFLVVRSVCKFFDCIDKSQQLHK